MFGGVPIRVVIPPSSEPKEIGMRSWLGGRLLAFAALIATGSIRASAPTLFMKAESIMVTPVSAATCSAGKWRLGRRARRDQPGEHSGHERAQRHHVVAHASPCEQRQGRGYDRQQNHLLRHEVERPSIGQREGHSPCRSGRLKGLILLRCNKRLRAALFAVR